MAGLARVTRLKGLALVPGGLGRPFGVAQPLRGVEDWRGIHFRSSNSQTQTATITELGAQPVNVGIRWRDEVTAGRLDGVDATLGESDVGEARNLTANIVLWPQFEVLVLNAERYDALTDEQRRWVAAAAQQAVAAAAAVEVDESSAIVRLRNAGVRVVNASEAEIAGLRASVRPVLDGLATDTAMGRIEAIADTFPGEAFPVPPRCAPPTGRAADDDPRHRPADPGWPLRGDRHSRGRGGRWWRPFRDPSRRCMDRDAHQRHVRPALRPGRRAG